MDADAIRNLSEEQVDMMLMMLQMGKMPEFSDVQTELPEYMAGKSNTTIPASPSSMPASYINAANYPVCMLPSMGRTQEGMRNRADDGKNEGSALPGKNSVESMREMMFRMAAMQPIHIDPESVKPPKRRNVKISKDPQSVAARHRRERISEKIRTLQRLVPGGTKMDTASMLDEAIHYVKFLQTEVHSLEQAATSQTANATFGFPVALQENYSGVQRNYSSRRVVYSHTIA